MTRKLIVSLLLLFGSAAAALPVSTAAPLPDENGTAPAVESPWFPGRQYAFVWRNWTPRPGPETGRSARNPGRKCPRAGRIDGPSSATGDRTRMELPAGIYHRIAAELAPAAIRPTAHAARHHARGTGMAADRRRLPVRKTGLQETLLPAAALRKAFRTGRTTSRPDRRASPGYPAGNRRCRDALVRIHRRIFPKS